ncbi:hypothetical protein SNN69_000411 [Cronobacter sakazakii]|nr:hypothetical protein [Cronobacter sakazakii]
MEKNIIALMYFSLLAILAIVFIKRRYYEIDHQSLLKQPIFWVSIGFPLVTCLFFGALIWVDKWNSFSLTSHGYSRFLEISKLPFLILASAVPFAAIVNNLHRTIQTEKQITESERKNKTDGYYAHAKFHTDYLKSLPETELKTKIIHEDGKLTNESKFVKITYPLSLYKKLYPKCNPINGVEYETDKSYTTTILKSWVNINTLLSTLFKTRNAIAHDNPAGFEDLDSLLKIWYKLEVEIIQLCNALEIIYPTYQNTFVIKYHDSLLVTSIASFKEMFKLLEAIEDISIGIIDAANQFTMVETHVFTKTKKLFSTWGKPTELDEMNVGFNKSQRNDTTSPVLILKGKRYRESGDTLAAEH